MDALIELAVMFFVGLVLVALLRLLASLFR